MQMRLLYLGFRLWAVLTVTAGARPVSLTVLISSSVFDAGALIHEVDAQRASGRHVVWMQAGSDGLGECGLEQITPDAISLDRKTLTALTASGLPDALPFVALNQFVLPDYAGEPTGVSGHRVVERDGVRISLTSLLHPATPLFVPRDAMQHLGVSAHEEILNRKLPELRKADVNVLCVDAPWSGSNGWSVVELSRAYPDFDIVVGLGEKALKQQRLGSGQNRVLLQGAGVTQLTLEVDSITRQIANLNAAPVYLSGFERSDRCLPPSKRLVKPDQLSGWADFLRAQMPADLIVIPRLGALSGPGMSLDQALPRLIPFDDRWVELKIPGSQLETILNELGAIPGFAPLLTPDAHAKRELRVSVPGRLLAGWGGQTMSLRKNAREMKYTGKQTRGLLLDLLEIEP